LILGLVLGAIIAIIIYKKDKGKTFDLLSKKLDDLMNHEEETAPSKKEVILPPEIMVKTKISPVRKTKAKLFKKPKA